MNAFAFFLGILVCGVSAATAGNGHAIAFLPLVAGAVLAGVEFRRLERQQARDLGVTP